MPTIKSFVLLFSIKKVFLPLSRRQVAGVSRCVLKWARAAAMQVAIFADVVRRAGCMALTGTPGGANSCNIATSWPAVTASRRPERAFVLHLRAFDRHCAQHITPRYTAAEIEIATAPPGGHHESEPRWDGPFEASARRLLLWSNLPCAAAHVNVRHGCNQAQRGLQ
jgi:hypothetical protein